MIFKLHYWFIASGANALGILLGVFLATYTDATATEIGFIYMMTPFIGIISRPIICSFADRKQAHQKYLMVCLLMTAVSYAPFVLIPCLGPEVYENYPRFCWYFLLTFKVFGDIAFGGALSIGDSLAINYAHRIGTEFSVYRVWATISWMVFGVVTGQINEIWFLPKYVPAFIILISASLIDMTLIWLWPSEYFQMVPINESKKKGPKDESDEKNGLESDDSKERAYKKIGSAMTKSLMPREVVWAHSKRKLLSLLTCSCFSLNDQQDSNQVGLGTEQKKVASDSISNDGDGTVVVDKTNGKERSETGVAKKPAAKEIDKGTQIRILFLLLRRDPRILLYAAVFVCAGSVVVPVYFFYMSLSDICHTDNRCDFSQLGGLLQVSMALSETTLFIFIKRIISTIGRLNTVSIAFVLAACKYSFYGTLWPSVDPYFALVSEVPQGFTFGIFLVLTVELAHLFANEVEFIIPELVERGIVEADDEESCAKLKLSLSATMQSLMACANDGLGRGFSSLIYGLILDRYSYHTLWLVVGFNAAAICIIIQAINIFDRCLGLELGLDVQFEKNASTEAAAAAAAKNRSASVVKRGSRSLSDYLDTVSIHSSASKLHQLA